ncbi:fibronectin type III domain-containing protein [Desulfurispirillum indicum]|uniref:fibronectin type III domain-containing protein n=1 Tax=Desulfurispirillum indicum TaxID=936456 RepID=UPI001CF9E446|nr:fibronectin type III domain-containing protein [Desulfurispirillum indicum]UCZ56185.1 fibronectin type III domain-containing protein [Desulfurispirillum indicum]
MNGCGGGGGGGGGTAPETPWNVSASLVDGGVSVSWTGVNNATAYHVYYSRTPDSGTTGTRFTPTHPELQPHTIVTGLENYKSYYFVVTASNKHGESAPSSEVRLFHRSV